MSDNQKQQYKEEEGQELKDFNQLTHDNEAQLLSTLLTHANFNMTPTKQSNDGSSVDSRSHGDGGGDGHRFSHRIQAFKAILSSPASEKRREYYLEKQKEKRRDIIKQVRSIISSNQIDIDVDKQQQQQQQPKQEQENTPQKNDDINNNSNIEEEDMEMNNNNNQEQKLNYSRQERKKYNQEKKNQKEIQYFSNHLMLAEPMSDIPFDFIENWFAVPVTNGKRCLVISQRDMTVARDPDGVIIHKFQSSLPFGSIATREVGGNNQSKYCILDCVYDMSKSTFFVLDILCWKGSMLYDHDTEFRFFWRGDKLKETTAHLKSSTNPFPFISLPYYSCDKKSLLEINQLNSRDNQNNEFLLFYHKESLYDFGSTPLFISLSIENLPHLIDKVEE